jgi:transcriptional regulator with XRE-family HTH domain
VTLREYGTQLRGARQRRGASGYAVARDAGLDRKLYLRSEEGTRRPEGPDEVLAIARALGLDDGERDRLLEAAGHWPGAFLALGPRDATLALLAAALADPLVPIAVRQRLRDQVAAAVATVRAAAAELDELQRALAIHRAGVPASGGAGM